MADIMGQMELHIPTSVLNGVIRDAVELNAPPVTGRKPLKIYYATMIGNAPPRFVLFVNDPELAATNYMGYLNNYLRKCFGFKGLPLDIKLRAKPKKDFVPGNHKKKKRHIKPGNRRK
jgi:GTP-binding protein